MCRDDTKLSQLASIEMFHPYTGTRHVTVVRLCGCLCFVWVVVLFVCLDVFLVCFLFVCCLLSVSVFALEM